MKGIAYTGALEVLDREGILQNIERVAGTSAGAMMAVLVGLRYSSKEMQEVLWDLNFKGFIDSSWGVLRNSHRLFKEYGWCKGDYFRSVMAELIERKTGNGEITFGELARTQQFRDIYLVGADLTTGLSKLFCAQQTPEVKVADAARISMSIPLIFAAIRDKDKKRLYVDGGLLENYAIKTFDQIRYVADRNHFRRTEYYDKINSQTKSLKSKVQREYVYNKETLGFRLDSEEDISMYLTHEEVPCKEIDSFFSYTKALVTTLIDFQNNVHLHSDDWQRTVYIDTLGVRAIDFDIPDDRKQDLVDSGMKYTERYLDWYNNDEEKANK